MAPATPDEGLMSGGEGKSPKARTKRLKRTPTATPRKSPSVREDGDSSGSGNSKIFHYFGAGSPEKGTPRKKPATSTPAAGAAGEVPQPVLRVTEPAKTVSPSPAPTWGKLVEPRKQQRWEMLRRLQGGGLGGVDPTAWARRSYSLSHTPVFQDLRPPGMGSTSGWGWASQSQVFGGARACRASPSVPPRERSGETGGDDVPDSARATVVAAGGRSRALQSRNFKAMVAWLSSSHAASAVAVAAPVPAAAGAPRSPRAAAAAAANPADKTLLEIALERQDGGPATAFMTLMSLAPEALEEEVEEEAEEEANEPLALALRLYHGASTWRRISRDPPPRRQGPGSRLHPDNPGLAAAVDEADDRERRRRSGAEHAGALALLSAGLAVSLRDAGAKGSGGRRGTSGRRDDLEDPDPLVALAPREALTATRQAAEDLVAGRKERDGEGGAAAIVVLRLTDEAREAIHRVHVAFFAAARHGPQDAPVVLREGLDDGVVFAGAAATGADGHKAKGSSRFVAGKGRRRPAPRVLSCVEAFAEYYRLVSLSDAMELAAGAGDPGLAYGSLHEASTALFPSGCPLCRRNHLRHRTVTADSVDGGGAALPTTTTTPPPHCDICELSARVVMRGVGLMERDKDYDSAFHYLDILLQASSQRLSVHRPRYWVRLVTDLGHKKRSMAALQACEKALAEASLPPPAESTAASPAVTMRTPAVEAAQEGFPERREAGEGEGRVGGSEGGDRGDGGKGRSGYEGGGSAGIAPGTSLEQAVLNAMLAELEPGWKGLHAENSICLGLFALLCWDALFAPLVPASPGAIAATPGTPVRRPREPMADASGEPAPIAKEPRNGQEEGEPQDPHCSAKPSGRCRGSGARSGGSTAVARVNLPDGASASMGGSTCFEVTRDDPSLSAGGEENGVFYPFPSPFQSEPADLMTPAFARRRRSLLGGVFESIERGRAVAMIRQAWSRHYGKACTGLNWNLFPNGVEGWATVASAIGPLPLSCICRNLASNYWAWRHGLPDLFLWRENAAAEQAATAETSRCPMAGSSDQDASDFGADSDPAGSQATVSLDKDRRKNGGGRMATTADVEVLPRKEACCKWVEVKGPGDSLSCAQEAWIDALVGAGADFAVLRVEDAAAGLPR
ncbi:conserved unknown protein [Ectocarpus siliculosus]|uniref:Fanconi-associated nuclease n=1 Tax=Ectocarpus siliculosus TaxID=2880 RepID=D7FLL1_ECTSI|nr:conserved unknown protein [Ectocarpus siliculosus]|eukprot:CBJ25827.1 conserved unknown protein [Ectocarpus siliculosus]